MATVSEALECLDTALDQAQEAGDPGAVEIIQQEISRTRTVKDTFTTYDVIGGMVKNERGNNLQEIRAHLTAELQKIPHPEYGNLFDCLDYLSIMDYKPGKAWPVNYNWIACYYVTGGSEGYYFHVDVIKEDRRELLILGKTLIENRDLAGEINAAIGKILQV